MARNRCVDAFERERRDLVGVDPVWIGVAHVDGTPDPACVELFASAAVAEDYVESLPGASDARWAPREEGDGRRLVDPAATEVVGVVAPVSTTVPGAVPPLQGSVLDGALSPESRLRGVLPGVADPPAVDRAELPFDLFDVLLFSEQGHLELRAGEADERGVTRTLDALAAYADRTVGTGTSEADDRVARNRIEDLDGYFDREGDVARYGKPRYRLAKRLSEWGGETGRFACLELWLLFELLLRLYPEHVSWEAGYEYNDDH